MAVRRVFRRFFFARLLSWRHFWARRAHWRISLATMCALIAFFIVVYLAIPTDMQSHINQTLVTTIQAIVSLDQVTLLASIAVLLVLVSFGLIFVHPYQRTSYLATSPSAIPLISVYIDAENQIPQSAIRPFTTFLTEYLNGRRADLLYFLDASVTATSNKYKMLYRFGFRPVDVPHDPTGKASVKEAVDKELAMHAYERALLGPAKQEFIIVTGDQDFVALVYRLAALGHHVQVWATPIRPAYRVLATYLDIELIDLSHVIADVASPRKEGANNSRENKKGQQGAVRTAGSDSGNLEKLLPSSEAAEPAMLLEAGEQQIYRAITETLKARNESDVKSKTAAQRTTAFRGTLGAKLGPRLAGVGYSASSRIDYWIEHLTAVGVLDKSKSGLPTVGPASVVDAARALFTVMRLAAISAIEAGREHGEEVISMSDLANVLTTQQAQGDTAIDNLLGLVARSNPKRATHARYFVRGAQALGLIEFDDIQNVPDAMRAPRALESLPSGTSDGDIAQAAESSLTGANAHERQTESAVADVP